MGEGHSDDRNHVSDRADGRLGAGETTTGDRSTSDGDRNGVDRPPEVNGRANGHAEPSAAGHAARVQQHGTERRRTPTLLRLITPSVAFSALLIVSLAESMALVVSLSTQRRLQTSISRLEVIRYATDEQSKLAIQLLETRVGTLEKTFYGQERPTTKTLLIEPAWDRNRDADLRARITALERWRMGKNGGREDEK